MLRRIVRALGPHRRRTWPHGGRPSTLQSGAIPYAWAGDEPTYLLITSRRTGRWIFPKGMVEDDMTPAGSAAKEAWEEAGVRGKVGEEALGIYRTEKVERYSRRMIAVEMYPLKVRLTDRTSETACPSPGVALTRRAWAQTGWAETTTAAAMATATGTRNMMDRPCEENAVRPHLTHVGPRSLAMGRRRPGGA